IGMQQYKVQVEETDGLVIRLNLKKLIETGVLVPDPSKLKIVRADPTKAVVIRTSTSPNDANASLSLFKTCAGFPTNDASSGVMTLTKVTLAQDPMETGNNERLAGTLTATLS